VPPQMHVARGGIAPHMSAAPALAASMTNSAGSGARSMPQPPMHGSAGSGARSMPQAPVPPMSALDAAMSALERMGDDDPTTIMTREDIASGRRDSGARRMPAPQPPSAQATPFAHNSPQAQNYQGPIAFERTIQTPPLASPPFPEQRALGPSVPYPAVRRAVKRSPWIGAAIGAGFLLVLLITLLVLGVL
jgi:hypothetical protein